MSVSLNILLISTYELSRQPFGLASPAAWLRREGHRVTCIDCALEPLPTDGVRKADLIAFYIPMHTVSSLSTPTAKTGIPGGICTMDNKASKP